MNLKPELISFNVCPFVQRSVITLLEKDVAFKLTYIDLNNPPQWFAAMSPLGKVPVLKLDDTVLFESAVINEYLDEVNLPSMHPDDPLLRAKNRAWIEFGSEMIMNHYNMTAAKDVETFTHFKDQLVSQFQQLEQVLGKGRYFNGNDFSLIDAAFAPLLMRIDLLDSQYPVQLYPDDSRVHQWSRAVAKVDSVKISVTADFEEIYLGFIKSLNSYYSTQIHMS